MASPTPFPLVSNLNGLLNGQAKGLGTLGSTGVIGYDIAVAPVQIVLSSSPASGGTVEFYWLVSEDTTTWSAGINPTSVSDQSSLIRSDSPRKLGVLNVDTGLPTTYVFDGFSVYQTLGYWSMFGSLVVWNRSGVAFSASGHVAQYSLQNNTAPAPVQYA